MQCYDHVDAHDAVLVSSCHAPLHHRRLHERQQLLHHQVVDLLSLRALAVPAVAEYLPSFLFLSGLVSFEVERAVQPTLWPFDRLCTMIRPVWRISR